jgi:hypothetical protein
VGWVLLHEGRVLQLTGTAEVHFDEPEDGQLTGGTHRFLWGSVARWREGPASSG